MGFLTGRGLRRLNEASGDTLVNIFIPSSPTPVTGYVIFVPAREVIPLPITVDEAIRIAITGGVVIPDHQANPESVLERFRQLEVPSLSQELSAFPDEEIAEEDEDGDENDPGEKRVDEARD
jgi:uncharacterized membrane protein